MTQRIDVVGAVIVRDGLVLCAQLSPPRELAALSEFPGGGKIDPARPHRRRSSGRSARNSAATCPWEPG